MPPGPSAPSFVARPYSEASIRGGLCPAACMAAVLRLRPGTSLAMFRRPATGPRGCAAPCVPGTGGEHRRRHARERAAPRRDAIPRCYCGSASCGVLRFPAVPPALFPRKDGVPGSSPGGGFSPGAPLAGKGVSSQARGFGAAGAVAPCVQAPRRAGRPGRFARRPAPRPARRSPPQSGRPRSRSAVAARDRVPSRCRAFPPVPPPMLPTRSRKDGGRSLPAARCRRPDTSPRSRLAVPASGLNRTAAMQAAGTGHRGLKPQVGPSDERRRARTGGHGAAKGGWDFANREPWPSPAGWIR